MQKPASLHSYYIHSMQNKLKSYVPSSTIACQLVAPSNMLITTRNFSSDSANYIGLFAFSFYMFYVSPNI